MMVTMKTIPTPMANFTLIKVIIIMALFKIKNFMARVSIFSKMATGLKVILKITK